MNRGCSGRRAPGALSAAALGGLWLALGSMRAEEAILLRPPDEAAVLRLKGLEGDSLVPLRARWDPATGRASAIEGRFPLGDAPDLIEASRRFFLAEPELFGYQPDWELRPVSSREGLGTRHVRFGVFRDGVPLAGAEVGFHLDLSSPSAPDITFVSIRLPGPLAPADPAPRIEPREARAAAEAAVSPQGALRGESRVGLELLWSPPPVRLTYAVRVDSLAPRGLFLVRVDARDGQVISAGDLIRYAPRDGTGKAFLVNPVVAMRDRSLEDHDDSADAVPAAAYSEVTLRDLDGEGGLTGPHVTTHVTPQAVRRVRFDFSFLRDHDGFEEVMVYYHIDSAQRLIQSLGFQIYREPLPVYVNSEPPGIPFPDQQAYYLPSDERPGTGALAFGSGGIDFAEDPEVILHEYGHALQHNQVPGLGSTFESLETFALGEGWADWFASAYLSAFSGGFGDTCHGEWAAAGFTLPDGEVLECGRRLDTSKTYPGSLVGQPHADGEIWSSSLWQVLETLGREDSLKLVLQSHFYLGQVATLEDGAQAVLRADLQLFQGKNEGFLRKVFTDRGLLAPPPDLDWFYLRKHAPALPVPDDGTPVTSKLKVVRAGSITAASGKPVLVYLKLLHPIPGELTISLRSPSGIRVLLHRAGAGWIPARPVIFGSTLEPAEPLAVLTGESPSGVWTLEVVNDSFFEEGTLVEWGLGFEGFLRGDGNRDGQINLADAIAILHFLFLHGELICPRAADFNDSGSLSVTDAVSTIRFLFANGQPPAQPHPLAGEDLTPDGLACN